MCGILGGTNNKWNYISAITSLTHRGPDAQKVSEVCESLTMAFARLSIIDLNERAMQPMKSSDENVYITFNGEIYDYPIIKEDLKRRGYAFTTESDTEVLLNAYYEWGDNFVEYIDGMFAIAIYDKRLQQLKLFRDRAGIKPLYWFYNGKDFAYSSELKGIEALLQDSKLEIDNTALFDYYNYLYIPDPKTIYRNVNKLESAHILCFDIVKRRIIKNDRYWDLFVNSNEGDLAPTDDQCEYIRSLINKNVQSQMIADVPVGTFLSGGIDSSIITIHAKEKNKGLHCFSIGFYDFEANELPYVECLERNIGLESTKYLVKKDDFTKLYFDMKRWFDEPFADTSAYPTFLVSKLARQKCIVALSGDGGDELFGGYTRYAVFNDYVRNGNKDVFEFLRRIHTYEPQFNKELLRKKLNISKDYDEYWFYKKYYVEDLPPITRMQYLDFWTYLPCDILTKTDRVGMAVSLETRVPFLAREVIEYAFSISQSERCYNGELKGILKSAYKNLLPDNLLYRRKWGFGIPQSFFGYSTNPQDGLEKNVFDFGRRI